MADGDGPCPGWTPSALHLHAYLHTLGPPCSPCSWTRCCGPPSIRRAMSTMPAASRPSRVRCTLVPGVRFRQAQHAWLALGLQCQAWPGGALEPLLLLLLELAALQAGCASGLLFQGGVQEQSSPELCQIALPESSACHGLVTEPCAQLPLCRQHQPAGAQAQHLLRAAAQEQGGHRRVAVRTC